MAKATVGLQPLIGFLRTVAATFDTPGSSSLSTNISGAVTLFESLGIISLQILGVFQDDVDPDTNIVWVQPPSFDDLPPDSMSQEYFEVSSALFAAAHPANLSITEARILG